MEEFKAELELLSLPQVLMELLVKLPNKPKPAILIYVLLIAFFQIGTIGELATNNAEAVSKEEPEQFTLQQPTEVLNVEQLKPPEAVTNKLAL